jgi:hypothetical protein
MSVRWLASLFTGLALMASSGCCCLDAVCGCGVGCGHGWGPYSGCVADGCGADCYGDPYGCGDPYCGAGMGPVHRVKAQRQRRMKARQMAGSYGMYGADFEYEMQMERRHRSRRNRRHQQYGGYQNPYGYDDMMYGDMYADGYIEGMDAGWMPCSSCNACGESGGGWVDNGEWQEGTFTEGEWTEESSNPTPVPDAAEPAAPAAGGEPNPMPVTHEPYYMPQAMPASTELSTTSEGGSPVQPVLFAPSGL